MGSSDQIYQSYIKAVRRGNGVDDIFDHGFSNKQVNAILGAEEKYRNLRDLSELGTTVEEALRECKFGSIGDDYYLYYKDLPLTRTSVSIVDDKVAEIHDVYTMSIFRRKGLMTMLFNLIFMRYHDYKFKLIAEGEYPARQYKRLGFRVIREDGGDIYMEK